MSDEPRLAIIMPAHNEAGIVKKTIHSIPEFIDLVIFVNDGSTDSTEILAEDAFYEKKWNMLDSKNIKKSFVIINQNNSGVGSAVFKGMEFLLEIGKNNDNRFEFSNQKKWIIIIMDADGQMNPNEIKKLTKPIIENSIDHVKGKRIGLKGMPISRKIGSFFLTILMRLSSGYNDIKDPQCGFRAIDFEMIKKWDFTNKWNDFGYTNWWLLESGRRGFKLEEVEIESIYNDSKSKLKIYKFLPKVSVLIFKKLWKRGFEWYILGKGGTSRPTRILMTLFWFSSIISTIIFFTFNNANFIILYSLIGFYLCKILDNREIKKRKEIKKSPLIN